MLSSQARAFLLIIIAVLTSSLKSHLSLCTPSLKEELVRRRATSRGRVLAKKPTTKKNRTRKQRAEDEHAAAAF